MPKTVRDSLVLLYNDAVARENTQLAEIYRYSLIRIGEENIKNALTLYRAYFESFARKVQEGKGGHP